MPASAGDPAGLPARTSSGRSGVTSPKGPVDERAAGPARPAAARTGPVNHGVGASATVVLVPPCRQKMVRTTGFPHDSPAACHSHGSAAHCGTIRRWRGWRQSCRRNPSTAGPSSDGGSARSSRFMTPAAARAFWRPAFRRPCGHDRAHPVEHPHRHRASARHDHLRRLPGPLPGRLFPRLAGSGRAPGRRPQAGGTGSPDIMGGRTATGPSASPRGLPVPLPRSPAELPPASGGEPCR